MIYFTKQVPAGGDPVNTVTIRVNDVRKARCYFCGRPLFAPALKDMTIVQLRCPHCGSMFVVRPDQRLMSGR